MKYCKKTQSCYADNRMFYVIKSCTQWLSFKMKDKKNT